MKNIASPLIVLLLTLFSLTRATAQEIIQDKEGTPLLVDYGVGFVTANINNASLAIGGTIFHYDRLRIALGLEGKATNGIASFLQSFTIVPEAKLNADIGIATSCDKTYFTTSDSLNRIRIALLNKYPEALRWLAERLDTLVNTNPLNISEIIKNTESLEQLLSNFKDSKEWPKQKGLRNSGDELAERKERLDKEADILRNQANKIREIAQTTPINDGVKSALIDNAKAIRSALTNNSNNSSNLYRSTIDYINDIMDSQWPNGYTLDISWINIRVSASASDYNIFVPSNSFDDRIIDTTSGGFLGLTTFNYFLTRQRLYLSYGLGIEHTNNGSQLPKASVIQRTDSPGGDNKTTIQEEKVEAIIGDFKEYWNVITQLSAYWKIHSSLPLAISGHFSYRHGNVTRPINLGFGLYMTKKTNTFQPVLGFLLEYRDETIKEPSDDKLLKRFGSTITTSIPFSIN